MKTRIRHIVMRTLQILMVSIACFTLYGCDQDNTVQDDEGSGTIPNSIVQVGFHIRLSEEYGRRVAETRADGITLPADYGDSTKYGIGTGYENYIGIADNDFCFLLFDGEGKFVETMNVLDIFAVGDSEYSSEYTVFCSLTKKPGGTFKVVALTNWGAGNYPQSANLIKGVTTIDDVCKDNSYTYAYPPVSCTSFIPSNATPIPMYGVKTCENVHLEVDKRNDIGDLYLLRAMAKVEVICHEDSELELASVSLSRYNTKGFRTPEGMDLNTTYVTGPHIPADVVTNETTFLDFRISASKDKAVIYIPEYRNTGTDRHCRLFLTFTNNIDRQYTIDFREYDNGKPTGAWFDILRNYCYRFTVNKTPEFEVEVASYGETWLDPVFGLDDETTSGTE